MAIALAPLSGLNAPLTTERFLELVDAGVFGRSRVELLEGRVTIKMAQNRLHINALRLVERAFARFAQEGLELFNQSTLRIGESSAPEPDFIVARYDPVTATEPLRAEDALLVLEVSVSTLREDREDKARIYAGAEIPEYWIVNPVARQVEIRRDPKAGGYQTLIVYGETDSAAPLFRPDAPIDLEALWPALDPDPNPGPSVS